MATLTDSEITSLTPPERLSLINRLWDSLDATHMPPLTAAQSEELKVRIAHVDEDLQNGIDWEDLKVELERRVA